jgi:hypothetical protein
MDRASTWNERAWFFTRQEAEKFAANPSCEQVQSSLESSAPNTSGAACPKETDCSTRSRALHGVKAHWKHALLPEGF